MSAELSAERLSELWVMVGDSALAPWRTQALSPGEVIELLDKIKAQAEAVLDWQAAARGYQSRLEHREAAIRRVRDVHQPIDAMMFVGKAQKMKQVCTGCGQDDGNWNIHPCPTIQALDEGRPGGSK